MVEKGSVIGTEETDLAYSGDIYIFFSSNQSILRCQNSLSQQFVTKTPC